MESMDKIYDLLNNIMVTRENEMYVNEIKGLLASGNYFEALKKMRELKDQEEKLQEKQDDIQLEEEKEEGAYPKQLSNIEVERTFIGLLLENPKLIAKYYFIFEICMFEDPEMLNIYKSVLYNEGSKYSSERAKNGFNFSKDTEEVYELKNKLIEDVKDKEYNIEKIYTELRKLFILRKTYTETPEK